MAFTVGVLLGIFIGSAMAIPKQLAKKKADKREGLKSAVKKRNPNIKRIK